MNPIFSTFILPAGIAIVTALVTSILTHQEIKRRAEIELNNQFASRYNEKKWDAYTKFTSIARRQIELSIKAGSQKQFNLIEREIWAIAGNLFLIGSDDVVRAFRSWRTLSMMNGPTDQYAINKLTELLKAMRSDLGYKETDLDLDAILGSLVPNYQRTL